LKFRHVLAPLGKRQSIAALQNIAVVGSPDLSPAFWSAAVLRRFSQMLDRDPARIGRRLYKPHFALASAMLERVRRREAKYVSTNGALLIRARLAGV